MQEVDEISTVGFGEELHAETCAIIYDKDQDFDVVFTVDYAASTDRVLPSRKSPEEKLAHLSAEQKAELLALLDKYTDCFSDRPDSRIRRYTKYM